MTIATPTQRQLRAAVFGGCMVAFLGFGLAAAFGVLLLPMSEALGWGREVFSLSIAVQLLCWGIAQPVAGLVADRYGAARVLVAGAIIAALGFLLRAIVLDPAVFVFAGFIAGVGTGACSFPIVIVALGKVMPPEKRSFVMGLGTAAASLGMFVGAPVLVAMINVAGWQNAILTVVVAYVLILPFVLPISRVSVATAASQSAGDFGYALRTAFQDRSYVCLFSGFFVCGFHVAFIQTHLPAFVIDMGMAAVVGAVALSLVGLFNIAGSFLAGWSGRHHSRRKVLSAIYFTRAAVIAVFISVPLSPTSVYVFAAAIGLLWLSTVPLTTGLVAQTVGLTYLSTLAGLVFFSHQVGSFLGAWLGGWFYDTYQDYTVVWWMAVILGVAAGLVHLPIREGPGVLARAEA